MVDVEPFAGCITSDCPDCPLKLVNALLLLTHDEELRLELKTPVGVPDVLVGEVL